MLNYLKITGLTVGVILNFKRAKLEWKRIVLASERLVPSIESLDLQKYYSRSFAFIRG